MEKRTEKTLEELLAINNFNHLKEFKEFEKLFCLNQLDEDGTPAIITDKISIIIFDNEDFNETYLIDIFNEFIEKNPNFIDVDNIDKFYVDNIEMKSTLFTPKLIAESCSAQEYEKKYLPPAIMTINPKENTIVVFKEQLQAIFNSSALSKILTWLQ